MFKFITGASVAVIAAVSVISLWNPQPFAEEANSSGAKSELQLLAEAQGVPYHKGLFRPSQRVKDIILLAEPTGKTARVQNEMTIDASGAASGSEVWYFPLLLSDRLQDVIYENECRFPGDGTVEGDLVSRRILPISGQLAGSVDYFSMIRPSPESLNRHCLISKAAWDAKRAAPAE